MQQANLRFPHFEQNRTISDSAVISSNAFNAPESRFQPVVRMSLLYSPRSQGAPKGLEASRFSALVHFLRTNTTRTQLWLEQQDTFRLRTEPRLPNGAARLLFTPTLAGLFVRHYHLMIAVNDYV